ncbi:MAG: GAF domain-containing protein [Chloroflexi bacterium]|nr:GAF domain-containing protein [Chloroflexota bacterium]
MSSSPLPSHLLDALHSLNEIGAAINRARSQQREIADILRLIGRSAITLVTQQGGSGVASSVIYTYDAATDAFELESRVAVGRTPDTDQSDLPRPQGLGRRAMQRRQRVLSTREADLQLHPTWAQIGARVGVCYPLIVAERPVGTLYVYLHDARQLTALELLLLDNFAQQAATAIDQIQQLGQVQRHLQRKEEELQRMRRANLLLSSRLRLQETLEAILQMALEVTDARYGIFRLVDRQRQQLITQAVAGDRLAQPAVEALPIDENTITGWVAVHRHPLLIPDIAHSSWGTLYYPLDRELTMRAELAVPLINATGRLEGVLNLESPTVGAFSEDDRILLQSLATQAVIAIQEVRLLDALQEVSRRLLTEPPAQVFARIVAIASERLDAATSALWLRQGDELVLQAGDSGRPASDRIDIAHSLTGQALLQRKTIFCPDIQQDPHFARPELARRQGWRQALIVPLLAGEDEEAVGALSVYSSDERFQPDDWALKVLTLLAHHAALAVRHSAHQRALRQAQEQQAIVETFAAVGDLAANLLHRLNNKIGIIPVRVEGIRDKAENALVQHPYLARNLDEIERSAIDAMQIMSESLSYLRPIELAAVDVAAAVASAREQIILPPDVSLHLDGLDTLPAVRAGQRRLAFVFTNLWENALAAMHGQGEIHVSGRQSNGWVQISVRDTGPGIDPDLHQRIFELNYSSADQRSGKLGFGLWWVKTLMARFGGRVWVESDGQHGAEFILQLPLVST